MNPIPSSEPITNLTFDELDIGRTAQLVHDFERTNAYVDGVKRDNVRGLMDLIEVADDRRPGIGGCMSATGARLCRVGGDRPQAGLGADRIQR